MDAVVVPVVRAPGGCDLLAGAALGSPLRRVDVAVAVVVEIGRWRAAVAVDAGRGEAKVRLLLVAIRDEDGFTVHAGACKRSSESTTCAWIAGLAGCA